MALTAALIDNFDDNQISSAWDKSGSGNSALVLEQNNRIEISHANTVQYNTLQTAVAYDFTNSSVSVELVNAGSMSIASHEAILGLSKDSANSLWFTISNGQISAYRRVASTNTQVGASLTYTGNEATYRWLRLRSFGGTIFWETSVNGTTWTQRWSLANPWVITSLFPYLQSGAYLAESAGSFAYFDNYNTSPKLIQTTQSADDAHQVVSTGVVTLTNTGTEATAKIDGTNHAGFRFPSIPLDRRDGIVKVTLVFPQLFNYSGTGTLSTTTLYGEKTANSGIFTTTTNDISNRTRTVNRVVGTDMPATQAAFTTNGLDVTNIVREITSQSTWATGNALSLLFIGNGTAGNFIQPYAYDYTGGLYKAQLIITTANGTSYRFSAAGSVDTTSGTGAWTNIGNLGATDGAVASATISGGGQDSNILKATNFNFAIPTNAKINGIQVKVVRNGTAAMDRKVQLIKAGSYFGYPHGKTSFWSGSTENVYYGGHNDTWGKNWTAADINDSAFGFAYQVANTSGGGSASVDSISVQVFYSNDTLGYYKAEQVWQPTLIGTSPQENAVNVFTDGNEAYGQNKIVHTIVNNTGASVAVSRLRYIFSALSGTYGADPKTGTGGTFYDRTGTPLIIRLHATLADAQAGTGILLTINDYLKSTLPEYYDYYLSSPVTVTSGSTLFVSIECHGTSGVSEPGFINHYGSPWSLNGNVDDDANQVTYRFIQGSGYVAQSNSLFYEAYSTVAPTPDASAFPIGNSELTVAGYDVQFGSASASGDSEMTASGYLVGKGSATLAGDSKMYADRITMTGGSNVLVSGTINPLAITKTYIYKIYDKNWNYLGIWDDVVSTFGYSQEINTAGSAINVTLARNSDSGSTTYDVIADDSGVAITGDDGTTIAAETETLSSIGPGTNVDLNLNVKIYEFSSNNLSISGDLVFTGYISMYTSQYGSTENTVVSVFSYGADLDNYVLMDGLNTRVPYFSQDPSTILKTAMSKFNTDGGIVTYNPDTILATNLIKNPSAEVDTASWVSGSSSITFTRDTTVKYSGTASFKMVNNSAFSTGYIYYGTATGTSGMPVTPSTVYKLQFQALASASTGQGQDTLIRWYDSAGTLISSEYTASWTPGTVWQLVTGSVTSPATAAYAQVSLGRNDNGFDALKDTIFWFDNVMFEASTTVSPYFDGSSTGTVDYSYIWTGTANNSSSVKTVLGTITPTSTTVSYTFNANTMLEVIKKCLELAPTDWFFYPDLATNRLYFRPRPTTPQHYFYLGKHILGLSLEKTMEGITNDVFFTGGKPEFYVNDTMSMSQGTDLLAHTPEVGSTWIKHSTTAAGQSFVASSANRIYKSGSGEAFYYNNTPLPTTDFDISADIYVASVANEIGLLGGLAPTGTDNGILAQISGTGLSLYSRTTGTWTQLGSTVTVSPTVGATYKMRLVREGQNIKFYWNNAVVIEVTSAASTTAGTNVYTGIRASTPSTNTTGYHLDNFKVEIDESVVPTSVYKRYIDSSSISTYRRGVERITDNRVKLESSADVIVASLINRNKNPRYRSNITISGSTYDIRSIKLGDLVGFKNFGNFIDSATSPVRMQVVRIDYTPDSVQLQLDTILPSVPKRLEDIKRNLNQEQVEDNPDAPKT